MTLLQCCSFTKLILDFRYPRVHNVSNINNKIFINARLILFQQHGYCMFRLSKAATMMQQQDLVKGRYIKILVYLPFTRSCCCMMMAAFDRHLTYFMWQNRLDPAVYI